MAKKKSQSVKYIIMENPVIKELLSICEDDFKYGVFNNDRLVKRLIKRAMELPKDVFEKLSPDTRRYVRENYPLIRAGKRLQALPGSVAPRPTRRRIMAKVRPDVMSLILEAIFRYDIVSKEEIMAYVLHNYPSARRSGIARNIDTVKKVLSAIKTNDGMVFVKKGQGFVDGV